ncbi:MAG: hypothetical protein ABI340_02115 [Nitrososphaera sp.]|jgi:hypothetical protein
MRPIHLLCGLLALISVVMLPSAFAQVTYADSNNPAGPLMMPGWAVGMASAGVATGIGIWSIVRKG